MTISPWEGGGGGGGGGCKNGALSHFDVRCNKVMITRSPPLMSPADVTVIVVHHLHLPTRPVHAKI